MEELEGWMYSEPRFPRRVLSLNNLFCSETVYPHTVLGKSRRRAEMECVSRAQQYCAEPYWGLRQE